MKKTLELKDRVYNLAGSKTPLALYIASRHTNRKSLLYFDETAGTNGANRELRYAKNQKSPFVDEQDGTAVCEPIIFEDGVLRVPKTNRVLQEFLYYSPDNVSNGGGVFEEFDPSVSAAKKVASLDLELDAAIKARGLDLNTMLAVGRIYLNGNVDKMSTDELKRDIRLFAKTNPEEFLDAVEDPDLNINNIATRAFSESYVTFRGGKDVFYNLSDNKKKILTVPFGENHIDKLATWLHTSEGQEFYKLLQKEFGE